MRRSRFPSWLPLILLTSSLALPACSQAPASQVQAPTPKPALATVEATKAPTAPAVTPAAQTAAPTKPAATASAGADVQAAKKEGKVVYYTSTPVNAAQ